MEFATRLTNLMWGLIMNLSFNTWYTSRALRRHFDWLSGVSADALRRRSGYLKISMEKLGPMDVESISATLDPPRIVLYLHGGGYFMGSIRSYRHWAFRMAYRLDSTIVTPEYRLAPENPYPAALEDAKKAYLHLRAIHPHTPIFLGGDSAGGGLVLATLLALRDEGQPMPKGAFVISAYTDLTGSGGTMKSNRFRDLWLSRKKIKRWARKYYGKNSPHDPYISPVFGSYENLPPLMILVGEPEVLLDDSRRVADRARKAGVEVELLVWPGMQHAWPVGLPQLAEAKEAMQSIASFLVRRTK